MRLIKYSILGGLFFISAEHIGDIDEINYIGSLSELHIILLILLFVLAFSLVFSWPLKPIKNSLKGKLGERRIKKLLSSNGFPALHGLYLRDRRGLYVQIDHLVLFANSIAAIETKNYSGAIEVSSDGKKWHCKKGRHLAEIANPIQQNEHHLAALRHRFPGVNFWGVVVFTGTAAFPRGLPSGARNIENFGRYLAEYQSRNERASTSAATEAAWHALSCLPSNLAIRRTHRKQLRIRHG